MARSPPSSCDCHLHIIYVTNQDRTDGGWFLLDSLGLTIQVAWMEIPPGYTTITVNIVVLKCLPRRHK
ncbi:hypothetical protein PAXRUDRAFT_823710 [Paxillus rubicundulus Ve08.2h10]|uniref:Uncharacterized protein n=1 Tax=Paxillus rubicundulus Ve08.2h10 TaxID=930991 RepID=A0A0D0DV94_9AGAM|nr:hypothetical protein PAXRUDRAFT_823710 [Paxillus rubicundulus Ve08.2h10]